MRQLYTDQDEVLFDAARPVILNGIEDIVARPDRADRAIFLTLEPISPRTAAGRRRTCGRSSTPPGRSYSAPFSTQFRMV